MITKPPEYINSTLKIHWSSASFFSVDNYTIVLPCPEKKFDLETISEIAKTVLRNQADGIVMTDNYMAVGVISDRNWIRKGADRFAKWIHSLLSSPYILQESMHKKIDIFLTQLDDAQKSIIYLDDDLKTEIDTFKSKVNNLKKDLIIDTDIEHLKIELDLLIKKFENRFTTQLAFINETIDDLPPEIENGLKEKIEKEKTFRIAHLNDLQSALQKHYKLKFIIVNINSIELSHEEFIKEVHNTCNLTFHEEIQSRILVLKENRSLLTPELLKLSENLIEKLNKPNDFDYLKSARLFFEEKDLEELETFLTLLNAAEETRKLEKNVLE